MKDNKPIKQYIGAILTWDTENGEKVISCSRRTLKGAEKNYLTTEKSLAIVLAIRELKPYLEGYHFKVVTDHMALKWLNQPDGPWSYWWSYNSTTLR